MSPDVHILLSGALSFGVPLALAIRELVVLGRERPKGKGSAGGGEPRAHGPTTPQAPAGEPPLPSCLIEALRGDPELGKPAAAPARDLEPV